MGMFDNISCDAPLPGDPPEFVKDKHHRFQTKDIENTLAYYHITEAGKLVRVTGGWCEQEKPAEPEAVVYTGTIEFYEGNSCASAWGVSFTRDGEDYEWVSYRALFKDGKLIEPIAQTERSRELALSMEECHRINKMQVSPELKEYDNDQKKSRLGQKVHLGYGGHDEGCDCTVIAESDREFVLQFDEPDQYGRRFKVEDRRMWGNLITASKAEMDAKRQSHVATRELQQAEARRLLAMKQAKIDDRAKPV